MVFLSSGGLLVSRWCLSGSFVSVGCWVAMVGFFCLGCWVTMVGLVVSVPWVEAKKRMRERNYWLCRELRLVVSVV